MLRKWITVPVIASVGLLFVAADFAQAQLFRGRERRMERRNVRGGVLTEPLAVTSTQTDEVATKTPATTTPDAKTPAATPTIVRVSYYTTPANQGQANAAQIRLLLPDPEARVTFDGNATKSTGAERTYQTPALTGPQNTGYRIQVVCMVNGREVRQERIITPTPGMTYVLDFTGK
jgi:uncharacterized protein (TIGR03000 family)